ncbi:protein-export chaperone SecB [Sphingomonas cannabina]|uniref:protein-export chaperone SecB n=1 Tax=Sphingomonas cannabina TaxID=2899123 RepID=UPI001F16020E|nr:protein-export chaperone SecB [Sphingomonas cannabina]UIJ44395.1 protein-export chaperone SecB [Sphingomonas cannabina]
MAEESTDAGIGETLGNGADTAPVAGVLSQYIKDLSFENPNAPAIYQNQSAPKIDVSFNIGSAQVGEDVYEVMLKIEARAETENGQVAFVVDLSYAGLFGLRNVPADQMQPFLLAEAPRILFPFARHIVAEAVRDGGFPPLMLDPIDFGALYLQQAAQAEQLAQGETAGQA